MRQEGKLPTNGALHSKITSGQLGEQAAEALRECAGQLPQTVSPRDKDTGHSSIHFPSVIS